MPFDDETGGSAPAPKPDMPTVPPPAKGIRGFIQNLFGGGKDLSGHDGAADGAAPAKPEEPAPKSEEDLALLAQQERDRADSQVSAKGFVLYELCCAHWDMPIQRDPDATFSLAQLMEASQIPDSTQRSLLKSIERDVRGMHVYAAPLPPPPAPRPRPAAPKPEDAPSTDAEEETLAATGTVSGEETPAEESATGEEAEETEKAAAPEEALPQEEEEIPEPDPVDAVALIRVAPDNMAAYLFLLPPLHNGQDVDPDAVLQQIAAQGVAFGVNEQKVVNTCTGNNYLRLTQIAVGEPPVNGKDGVVIDHYKQEVEIHLTVKDDNTIDYKDLNWLQTVYENDVICDIILPTEATPGTSVKGAPVPGKNGRAASVPKGQNTRITEDGTALVSTMDGVVSFQSGRFRVDPLLIIKGDVETETGNLDVVGDVLIHGDIHEGFTVTATGNITVQGMIEGATVTAGGTLQVGRGMNGNSVGNVKVKQDVLSKFLENANVTAGGKIISDTIINSTIQSDESVMVTTGRGSIIGGSITALNSIEATTIGNQSNRKINIVLGSTTAFLREKEALIRKHTDLVNETHDKEKNIRYLSAWEDELNEADAKKLDDLRLGLSVQKMQLANLSRRIDVMERRQQDNASCRIKATTIFPPCSITIGDVSKTLRETAYNALVYLKDGDVHVANV